MDGSVFLEKNYEVSLLYVFKNQLENSNSHKFDIGTASLQMNCKCVFIMCFNTYQLENSNRDKYHIGRASFQNKQLVCIA